MPQEGSNTQKSYRLFERCLNGGVNLLKHSRSILISLIFMIVLIVWFLLSFQSTFNPEDITKPLSLVSDQAGASGVCPPFALRDEEGNVIDPFNGENDSVPYSPRQTCGASNCHDYNKITEGYHFTQGRGEDPTATQRERIAWASTPGNYGGSWCSPAPLYRYLSPKNNETARTIDMTSYSFLTAGCGACHPGGGSAEIDRGGKRYDHRMADPTSGFIAGGDNNLDGDYFQARWSESGVLEADCLICHMPNYSMSMRNAQITNENFRWSATAGAGFGTVMGKVSSGEQPLVSYEKSRFDAEGNVLVHIVREPRNEACLACHAKPGWKKRGANFRPRTDVHLRAGLKCVDCHQSGSLATDPRIRGKEVHQFGKGDDPGGRVRDDLDGTVRTCEDCHTSGALGAPIAKHAWLPPLHLDELACQTCHIPERTVKAALVQAGDVLNPGARIPTKGKHLWTFYGPDGAYWNHYGDLSLMGYDDKPTDPFRPVYVRYGDKIYPVNRVHSAWPGIEIAGQTALMQPRMGDVFKMWSDHHADPSQYPLLDEIRDDNEDGVPEVNRSVEIDALIASVTEMLTQTGYPMDGKHVVWVADDRVYSSGKDIRTVEKQLWESSPYANVHKYTHDIYPARSALGSGGCTDCHASNAPLFYGSVLETAFAEEDARPRWIPNYTLLELTTYSVELGAIREQWLKPLVYCLGAVAALLLFSIGIGRLLRSKRSLLPDQTSLVSLIIFFVGAVLLVFLAQTPDWLSYVLVSRYTLDASHPLIAMLFFILAATALLIPLPKRNRLEKTVRIAKAATCSGLVLAMLSGGLMLLRIDFLTPLTRLSYTTLEVGLIIALVSGATVLLLGLIGDLRNPEARQ